MASSSKILCVGGCVLRYFLSVVCLLLSFSVGAQVAVDLSAFGVKVKTGDKSGSNVAVNSAGSVDSSVEMEGVAVINGEVFIDGDKVPKGRSSHKSRKSGIVYEIKWGKDGSVTVRER